MEATGIRRCEECDRPLPSSSRPDRRFCSARCRHRNWDGANRPTTSRSVPLDRVHWHGPGRLVGHITQGYWRGQGCPPECPSPPVPPAWSTGIPEGREGLPPIEPRPHRRPAKAATGRRSLPSMSD